MTEKLGKQRIDQLLVERGMVASREKARALIMAGQILVNGQKVEKAGTLVPQQGEIRLLGSVLPYVSRGGLKLEKAIKEFGIVLEGKVMLDVGASTGGFTDCALQHGATRVYAVDVGYGQLAWSVRSDPRVVCRERFNARHMTPDDFPELFDFVTADVSFISLDHILPAIAGVLAPEGEGVVLIKPQFEAGREHVGKKGVVRDKAVHEAVIQKILTLIVAEGMKVLHLSYSPIRGPEGNIEYLVHFSRSAETVEIFADPSSIVEQAHQKFLLE